jgi:hypothetical protein
MPPRGPGIHDFVETQESRGWRACACHDVEGQKPAGMSHPQRYWALSDPAMRDLTGRYPGMMLKNRQ